MKLLIYFIIFQLLTFSVSGSGFFCVQNAVASDYSEETSNSAQVTDSYEVRYERWKGQLQRLRESRAARSAIVSEINLPKNKRKSKAVVLPDRLPAKTIAESDRSSPSELSYRRKIAKRPLKAKRAVRSAAPQKRVLDSREEFLSNIPRDNTQVQALLSMVDHTKVYFSINEGGELKDLFKDPRFKEIYTEEMERDTKKLTYHFFKGYQDMNKPYGEAAPKKLKRDIKIYRDRIENYLETTGIKSKLTRSLTGSYPKVPSVDESTSVIDQDATE